MFYGEFDSRTRVLRYVNAGHCRPIVISHNGDVTTLTGGDLPIGLFPEVRYKELSITLAHGWAIVIYSDGLTDAMNVEGEEFGEERLLNHCRVLPKGATAQQICTLLCRTVADWSAGAEQFDDTTIVVLTAD
jgi:sigma-B regulation protein RsbU (phosphoserine phosphatase)